MQGFGIAEGRHKEHLKNMANAAGQSCRDYTPPGGETLDQVSRTQSGVSDADLVTEKSLSCLTAPPSGPVSHLKCVFEPTLRGCVSYKAPF